MAEKRVIEQTASSEIYNDDWFLKDSVLEGTSKISGVNLKELLGADGTQALEEIANAIAEEYDSTHTYTYNSWVFHEGTLYRCISQSVTGTWDATKWQAKTIKEFIADSENLITSRLRAMFGEYLPISTLDPPSIEAISKGDIFIYQRTNKYKFYRAKADHPQGVTEFDIDDWDEFDTVADLIEDVTENAGKVDDVKVDGTSVVTNKVAEIVIPVKDVQVKTDSTYDSVVDASGNAKIDLSSMTAYGEVPNLPQAIATFKDGADAPMKSLKVAIEPVQSGSGDPSPTNVRPISGWDEVNVNVSGVNVWDEEWEVGAISNSNGGNYALAERVRSKNYISVKSNTSYYLHLPNTYSSARIACYDKDKTYLGQAVGWLSVNNNTAFTTPSNTFYIRFVVVKTDETYNNDISINYPSTDTSYHAYSGNAYTIDLGGTRYGGEVDVVNGTMTVNRASIKLNDLNWTKQNTSSNNWRFTSSQSIQNIKLPTSVSSKIDNLCSVYQNVTANETWTADKTGIAINTDGTLIICDLNQADTTALGAVIANQTYCYELATPQTIQLTPTQVKSLLGSNNVWADTGDINDCVYRRDMSSTIDDIIARLEALEG